MKRYLIILLVVVGRTEVNGLHLELDKQCIKGTSVEDAFYILFIGSGQEITSKPDTKVIVLMGNKH
jgi:hypothetical protein